MPDPQEPSFDFHVHRNAAVTAYLEKRVFFEKLAEVVQRILEEALERKKIKVHSVQARAKDPTSFGNKVAQPSDADANTPKYPRPFEQIFDLSGVRVITHFPKTLGEIDKVLKEEFEITERSDRGAMLFEAERFGYQSIHYLVKLSAARTKLPEYRQFTGVISEIQVRTILQHAWAEIEHDIQYKSSLVIPVEIRRRFMALAGLLEMADREFQAIQDADTQLTVEARSLVEAGKLEEVEITPDALKAFLDQRLGPDGRISDFSYDWLARLVRRLGFRTLAQIEQCIEDYDDDTLSRLATGGTREGQTTRLERILLAGMGEKFIARHAYAELDWFGAVSRNTLGEFEAAGVPIGDFDPQIQG
jgi:ppGpp synthetase/RelA/SpoT-type nucleotidyltranferase